MELNIAWQAYLELRVEGNKLIRKGDVLRLESDKLFSYSCTLRDEGDELYKSGAKLRTAAYGNKTRIIPRDEKMWHQGGELLAQAQKLRSKSGVVRVSHMDLIKAADALQSEGYILLKAAVVHWQNVLINIGVRILAWELNNGITECYLSTGEVFKGDALEPT